MHYFATHNSPVGLLTLAANEDRLCGLWLAGQKYHAASLPQGAQLRDDLPLFGATKHWLQRYFRGENPAIDELPLDPPGTQFRQAVWAILRQIPYGQLTTYGHISRQMAHLMGKPTMSAQAVGGAVGHNPISIIIPCHRVVGQDGSLTGYAGGLEAKRMLLQLEGANLSTLYLPTRGTAL